MAKLLPAGKSITATHLWQDIEVQMMSFNILCLPTANHMKERFMLYIGAPLRLSQGGHRVLRSRKGDRAIVVGNVLGTVGRCSYDVFQCRSARTVSMCDRHSLPHCCPCSRPPILR